MVIGILSRHICVVAILVILFGCSKEKPKKAFPPEKQNVVFHQKYPEGSPREIVSEKDGAEMVLIPEGEFLMGSTKDEAKTLERKLGINDEQLAQETPQHVVHLDAFYIDKHETTNAQYKKFIDATGHPPPSVPTKSEFIAFLKTLMGTEVDKVSDAFIEQRFKEITKAYEPWAWKNGTYPEGKANHPVVLVSFHDAAAYCEWAQKRLPTEAEWEKAACGTDGWVFPWGNEWEKAKCNSAERIAQRELPTPKTWGNWLREWMELTPAGRAKNTTQEVGSYPAGVSPYFVYDVAGNVSEWCADWYDENYYSLAQKRNPKGPSTGKSRVVRGGSWNNIWFDQRCVHRSASPPISADVNVGFRCALDVW